MCQDLSGSDFMWIKNVFVSFLSLLAGLYFCLLPLLSLPHQYLSVISQIFPQGVCFLQCPFFFSKDLYPAPHSRPNTSPTTSMKAFLTASAQMEFSFFWILFFFFCRGVYGPGIQPRSPAWLVSILPLNHHAAHVPLDFLKC